MRVAIVGSRSFNDFSVLEHNVNSVITPNNISYIISGGANGTDSLAERYAQKYNIDTQIFKPEYKKYTGREKIAPLIRNRTIVENCDILIAFPTSDSRGTRHIINMSYKLLDKDRIYIFEM